MKLSKVKLTLTKYRMKNFQINVGSGKKRKKYSIDGGLILGMGMVYDFDTMFTPFWHITLQVPNKILRKMYENKEKLTATLLLQKGKFKTGLKIDENAKTTFKTALKGTFHIVVPDATAFGMEEDELLKLEKGDDAYEKQSTITIALYTKDFYKARRVYNFVLTGATVSEAVAFLCTQAKISKVLMAPLTNTKKHEQLPLLPNPLKDELQRLQKDEKIHKNGTLVFFDLDRLYIIDKKPQCTAYKTGEYKTTYVVGGASTKGASQTGGCYAYTAKKCNVINATSISKNNEQQKVKAKLGDNPVASSGLKVTKANKKTKKTTSVINSSVNQREIKRITKESKRVLRMSFRDIDFSMMTPNKLFIVTLDSTKYKKMNGKYRLAACHHTFSKEGSYLQMNTSAEFKG